jgi:hypothetical protein
LALDCAAAPAAVNTSVAATNTTDRRIEGLDVGGTESVCGVTPRWKVA